MKRAAVALLVMTSMLGCFPNNARHRTIAKYSEGGALVAGIAISAFANTGADCDEMAMAGVDTNCRTKAKWLSTAGVVLILGGLLGFVATISTAEDEDKTRAVTLETTSDKGEKADKPAVKLPPGVTPTAPTAPPADDGSAAGSGAASGSDASAATASGSASAAP